MDNNMFSDLTDIVRRIESKKILLPDFQRGFVWKDEEMQKKIVASVLAKMPIGSVLLLKSKPDEYASKRIGCSTHIETDDLEGEVEYLLDGQQRITVLANVFSNVIHEQCEKIKELETPTLKRRFFLRIPKWNDCYNDIENDIFGVKTLDFKYQNPDTEEPEFLSGDILDFVYCVDFYADDQKPYNPHIMLSTELDNFCISQKEGYLIPLFLKAPSDKIKDTAMLRYDEIINAISENIKKEIENYFVQIENDEDKRDFIDYIFGNSDVSALVKTDYDQFKNKIGEKAKVWKKYIDRYLENCVKKITLNRIIVSEEQRERAIDIYENLNRGGVSLSTFDLIMARVAKVNKKNFLTRMIEYIQSTKEYEKNLIPSELLSDIGEDVDNKKYNASLNTKCYNERRKEISAKYIDVFLDVLSLYCNNPQFNEQSYTIDYIKKRKILSLRPEEIDENAEKTCIALDRALFFFQTRCGVRTVSEINYSMIWVLVATLFIRDEWFFDKKVHDILEAWYWSSVFGGAYDKDQNSVFINNLQNMIKTLNGTQNVQWIKDLQNYIFDAQNFSDKEFVLMDKAKEERYPKAILKTYVCQYLLSCTYCDMFDENKKISVFCEDASELEAHHIIPLGSVKKIGELTSKLRDDKSNICNSPMNFVLITKNANKEILEDPLAVYINKITLQARSKFHFASVFTDPPYTDDQIHSFLEGRYNGVKGEIMEEVTNLLS